MQTYRYQKTGKKKSVGKKLIQRIFIKRRFHQLRHFEQREIHPFVVQRLSAQKADGTEHDKIAEKDKSAPDHQRGYPNRPWNLFQNLPPAHLSAADKTVVELFDGFFALGVPYFWKNGVEDLAPSIFNRSEMIWGCEVDKEGTDQSRVGDTRSDDHQDPGHQQLFSGKPVPSFEYFTEQGGKYGQEKKHIKGSQRKVTAPKRCGLSINIVERCQQTDEY